jgi:hypothetical protein
MLSHARELFEDYYRLLASREISARGQHLIGEVRARLRDAQYQYSFLLGYEAALLRLEGVSEAQSIRSSLAAKRLHIELSPPRSADARTTLQGYSSDDEFRTTLEKFYWGAARVRDIMRDSPKELPELHRFEAKGVRDVRNHLVQHPTKNLGVPVYSFAYGGPAGPQLKPVRFSGDPPGSLDEGLAANAAEFERNIESTLAGAISRIAT